MNTFLLSVLRILAIGNSFSIDALEQEFVPASLNAGITPIVANLYIPSCSLEMHDLNATTDSTAYSMRTWGLYADRWDTVPASIRQALLATDWDVVTLQQASHESGRIASYEPYISHLIDTIRAIVPHAHIVFHQTWAYPVYSTYRYFERWNYDQQQMYDSIVRCSQWVMDAHPEIEVLIPTGTILQEARQDFYRSHPDSMKYDPYCRDGLHLSFDRGRKLAAHVWLQTLRRWAR